MISFELSEEQKQLRDLARDFAKKEIIPKAAEYDETAKFPKDILEKAFEVGLLNLCVPSKFGGGELSNIETVIVTEELGYGCTGVATSMMVNDLALTPIVLFGSDELKEKFLKVFTKKYTTGSFCLTEPDAGSDVAGLQTRATKQGDYYVLNGVKNFITNGSYAELFTVFASLDPSKRHESMCCFAVEKQPGITVSKKENKMGQRASDTVQVVFNNVKVLATQRIGKDGEGWLVAMKTLDKSRPLVAAAAIGVARRAMECALDYSKERSAFGKTIGEYQAIQFMLADMAKAVEASRLLCWKAAWLLDQKKPSTHISSMAKCFSTDTAVKASIDAVQIYGGYGYMKDYPVEKLMRDSKLLQIYEGTNQIQRIVIARELLRNYSFFY
ncbi:MAG: acyl-CoA dehydrogenase family protein [Deltaproteobacteria bacterium]|nr:acyl-CoA dehydrogenase family protein [Deltaproteobacteria bacterium]